MKYLPLFFCMVFYACDVGTNNELNDLSSGSATSFNSSPSVISSSSHEISSSSLQRDNPYTCKSLPTEELLNSESYLYFDKQGGTDSIIGGFNSIIEGPDTEECEYTRAGRVYLYYENGLIYDENGMPIKVESDYCKDNYCHDGVFSQPATMKKECSWYSVTITSKTSLLISVNKNETGKERSEYISFVRGGCALVVGGFTIIQSAGNK
ncbi:MAG: hypothetical protein LBQ87_02050 [Candidatus Fibromonas sp.]|jgi:hypothetical protein|nr:hypothetical protein [Candidatus Fibromonas sp.]